MLWSEAAGDQQVAAVRIRRKKLEDSCTLKTELGIKLNEETPIV